MMKSTIMFFYIIAWNFSTKVLYMSKKHKFHPPQNNNPPSTFIEFLDFAPPHVYSNLHVY